MRPGAACWRLPLTTWTDGKTIQAEGRSLGMPKTDSAMLEHCLTLFTPEWWEQAPATTDARWAREEHAMEPERLRSRAYRADDQRAVVELLLSAQAAEPGF